MGLRLQVAPDTIVDVPAAVEAKGETAIDAFVLEHAGVDLGTVRAESARILAERRATADAEAKAATKRSEAAAAAALEGGGLERPATTTTHDAGDAGEEE